MLTFGIRPLSLNLNLKAISRCFIVILTCPPARFIDRFDILLIVISSLLYHSFALPEQ